MHKLFKDLTGQRFGHLVVLERAPSRRYPCGKQATFWKVQCDCGRTKEVRLINLETTEDKKRRHNSTKSCGATDCPYHQKLMAKGYERGQSGLVQAWNLYRRKANDRKIPFSLSQTVIKELFDKPCHYCGTLPANIAKSNTNYGSRLYSGIDRLDPKLGYVVGNVVSCCWNCNRMKGALQYDEFFNHIEQILLRRNNGTKR